MGVQGLWTILDKAGNPVELESLNKKRLAIDASIWAHQFLKALKDGQGNIVENAHILGFLRRICKLIFYNIKPVFVFDGPAPALKRRTLKNRREQREQAEENLKVTAEKILLSKLKVASLSSTENSLSDLSGDSSSKKSDSYQVQEVLASYYSSRKRDRDTFELPKLEKGPFSNVTAEDPRYDFNEELLQYLKEFRPDMEEVSLDAFDELPIVTQYEIINELRGRSRQTSSKRLQHMINHAPKALDFSQLQIQNLMQRNQLTQKYLDVVGIGDERNLPTTARIASSKNRAFALVKNSDSGGGWKLSADGSISSLPSRSSGLVHSSSEAKVPQKTVDFIKKADSSYDSDLEFDDSLDFLNKDFSISSQSTSDAKNVKVPSTTKGKGVSSKSNSPDLNPLDLDLFQDSDDDFKEVDFETSNETKLKNEEIHELDNWKNYLGNNVDPYVPDADVFFHMALYEWSYDILKIKKEFFASQEADPSDINFDKIVCYEEFLNEVISLRFPQNHSKKILDDVELSNIESKTYSPVFQNASLVDSTQTEATDTLIDSDLILSNEDPDFSASGFTQDDVLSIEPSLVTVQPNEVDSFISVDENIETDVNPSGPILLYEEQDNLSVQLDNTLEAGIDNKIQEIEIKNKAVPDSSVDLNKKNLDETKHEPNVLVESSNQSLSPLKNSDKILSLPEAKPSSPKNLSTSAKNTRSEEQALKSNKTPPFQSNLSLPLKPKNYDTPVGSYPLTSNQDVPAQSKEMLNTEVIDLLKLQANQKRLLNDPSASQFQDIKELLTLFGIPYLDALGEAEAQCAKLTQLGLVDGIATDDSDVFLFGGTPVFRHLFHQGKHVCCYSMDNIAAALRLTQNQLIDLAHLLGSDYTEGIVGVGPVSALEILASFPDGLKSFYDWWKELSRSQDKKPKREKDPVKRKLIPLGKRLYIPESFLNPEVSRAYLNPLVDDSKQSFQWGKPDLPGLQIFLDKYLGWSKEKVNELINPIIQHQNRLDKSHQTKMSDFFRAKSTSDVKQEINSKRLMTAIENLPIPNGLASRPSDKEPNFDLPNLNDFDSDEFEVVD